MMLEYILEIIRSAFSFAVSSMALLYSSIPGMLSLVITVLSLMILFRFVALPILGGSGFAGSFSDMSLEIRSASRRSDARYSRESDKSSNSLAVVNSGGLKRVD